MGRYSYLRGVGIGLCAASLAAWVFGHPELVVVAVPVALGIGSLLWAWPSLSEMKPPRAEFPEIYARLSHGLEAAAKATRSLIAAGVAAAGVGLRAALPIVGPDALRVRLAV